ncbi:MAG: aminotransferase [Eubacterium sp.]|nr:aminotransferase [Eubacterium sp.]
MKYYSEMTIEELKEEEEALMISYEACQAKELRLNMARGKPSSVQLDISNDMLGAVTKRNGYHSEDGLDCRNYGGTFGIPEAQRTLASIMECNPEHVIVYGNSSLNLMFDLISYAYTHGLNGNTPWGKLPEVKFLCPVPGYDRHFAVTEHFGIKMINIPMDENGPDMDMVEQYVNNDPTVKGMWCVPKFENPEGICYSDEVIRRMAGLRRAADDFRIYYDNAYAVHYLYEDDQPKILNLIDACVEAGHPDIYFEFCSTSKITYAGGGISGMTASENNLSEVRNLMSVSTIGYDKVNMLRNARYLKEGAAIPEVMMKHAAILRPKFELVVNMLEEEIGPRGIGSWVSPKGGYFVSFHAMKGCAKEIVRLAKEAGVVLTPAGAPFPYGKDPDDSVIRIAPSLPPMGELKDAMEIFMICVKLASVRKLQEELA